MRIKTSIRPRRRVQQRRQRAARSTLRDRIEVLRIRLARRRLAARTLHQRVAGRVSPLERVMRRTAIHTSRAYTAHVRLQALLGGVTMRHTERVETRQLREVEVPVHTLRQHDRTRVTERVLHQRLLERLARTQAPAAAPRLSFVTRVEQRHAAPRIQLTMVKAQAPAAPAASAASAAKAETVTAPGNGRTDPSQRRVAPAAPPLALPPQELSRLTDHVIRQLDHRVLSWQERTGRI